MKSIEWKGRVSFRVHFSGNISRSKRSLGYIGQHEKEIQGIIDTKCQEMNEKVDSNQWQYRLVGHSVAEHISGEQDNQSDRIPKLLEADSYYWSSIDSVSFS